MKKRLHWVDTAKAVCIICVYIAHTYGFLGKSTAPCKLLVYPFYVNTFFFISGYLLYKKHLISSSISTYSLNIFKKGILDCIYRLAIPTIIFSTIIYLPKIFFHNQLFSFSTFLIEIFGGVSFWFTSALFIAQITILFIFLTRKQNFLFYLILTSIIFLTLQAFCDFTPQPAINYFPWYWRTGLIYTLIMTIGGAYAICEKMINKWFVMIMAITSFVGYYLLFTENEVTCLGLSGRCTFAGFITSISTCIIIVETSKRVSSKKILTFIGENSIIFYFLSGAMPATYITLFTRLGITGNSIVWLTFILSITNSYFITYIVKKYIPFLTDIRLIIKK